MTAAVSHTAMKISTNMAYNHGTSNLSKKDELSKNKVSCLNI